MTKRFFAVIISAAMVVCMVFCCAGNAGAAVIDPNYPDKSGIYMRTSFNSWSRSDRYKLNYQYKTSNGRMYSIYNIALKSYDRIQFYSSPDGVSYYENEAGYHCYPYSTNNGFSPPSDGVYTIMFNDYYDSLGGGGEITFLRTGDYPEYTGFYLRGTFTDRKLTDNYMFEKTGKRLDGDVYIIRGVKLTPSDSMEAYESPGGFVLRSEDEPDNIPPFLEKYDTPVTESGYYNVYLEYYRDGDSKTGRMWVEKTTESPEHFYLSGSITNWERTNKYMFEDTGTRLDGKVYVVKGVKLAPANQLNVYRSKGGNIIDDSEYGTIDIYSLNRLIYNVTTMVNGVFDVYFELYIDGDSYSTRLWVEEPQQGSPSSPDPGYKIGDLNGDDQINGADAGVLSRYAAGWKDYDKKIKNMAAADINKDGNVNGADAGILARYTSGWKNYEKYFTTKTG